MGGGGGETAADQRLEQLSRLAVDFSHSFQLQPHLLIWQRTGLIPLFVAAVAGVPPAGPAHAYRSLHRAPSAQCGRSVGIWAPCRLCRLCDLRGGTLASTPAVVSASRRGLGREILRSRRRRTHRGSWLPGFESRESPQAADVACRVAAEVQLEAAHRSVARARTPPRWWGWCRRTHWRRGRIRRAARGL